jgi:hypothetical protein
MNERCKHVKEDGFNCGSYAFNLYKDDIDQGNLCDVHYWQSKAQRTWVGLTDEELHQICNSLDYYGDRGLVQLIEAKLKEKNT